MGSEFVWSLAMSRINEHVSQYNLTIHTLSVECELATLLPYWSLRNQTQHAAASLVKRPHGYLEDKMFC